MTNQLGQINPTTIDEATKAMILSRAASEIEYRTGAQVQNNGHRLLIDGTYVHLVDSTDGPSFTTPFSLGLRVREVLKEINEF